MEIEKCPIISTEPQKKHRQPKTQSQEKRIVFKVRVHLTSRCTQNYRDRMLSAQKKIANISVG